MTIRPIPWFPSLIAALGLLGVSCQTVTDGSRAPRAEVARYDWYDPGGPGEVSVRINLAEQKARFFRAGRDIGWSLVTTGMPGFCTPPGRYQVLEKKVDKHSNRYGRMVDAAGRIVDTDATSDDPVPEGGDFEPAPMPYWMRITWKGIGMHAGPIPRPGQPVSHGCIRLPREFAPVLFRAVEVGTPVTVVEDDVIPGHRVNDIRGWMFGG